MTPTLTIITSAYNAEKYLPRMLDSVAPLLDKGDVEFIVVNDGSKDGTGEILNSFAQEHNHVQVIHQDNAGLSAARNNATIHAHGKYVWFCDADDRLYTNKVTEMLSTVESLKSEPELIVCNAMHGPEGEPFRFGQIPDSLNHTFGTVDQWYRLFAGMGEVCFYWYKRSIIQDNQMKFRRLMLEDWHFHISFVKYTHTLYFTSEALYRYYTNLGSITQTANWRERRIFMLKLVIDLLQDVSGPLDNDYKRWVTQQCNREILMMFREAHPNYVPEIWDILHSSGVMPLKYIWEQELIFQNFELLLLNNSLKLFRSFSRLRVKPIW